MILSLEERKSIRTFQHPTPKFDNFKLFERGDFICSIYLKSNKTYGNFPKERNIEHLRKWSESLLKNNLQGIIFHNCFTVDEVLALKHCPVRFVVTGIPKHYASGMYRFELYHKFLTDYSEYIDNVFFTDSTDLDVLKNPFIQDNYSTEKIYVGYEPVIKDNKWMKHACNGFKQYLDLCSADKAFANSPLLNAGLVGGNSKVVAPYIKRIHEECKKLYPINYVQDMPIVNYIAYTEFNDLVEHGSHVNTVFTAYEQNNTTSWFRHK